MSKELDRKEVEEEEEEEEETRCICQQLEPPDDSGFFIQCENCGCWQHGYCVGITNDDAPEKYWCEQCKPELHHIYTSDLGEQRSVYKPIQEAKRRYRRSARTVPSTNSDDNSNESGVNGKSNSNSSTDHSSGGRENVDSLVIDHDEIGDDVDDEEKKLLDRKRATFQAREEKQYQMMLEKALRESRRESDTQIISEVITEETMSSKESKDQAKGEADSTSDKAEGEVVVNTNTGPIQGASLPAITESLPEVKDSSQENSSIKKSDNNRSQSSSATEDTPKPIRPTPTGRVRKQRRNVRSKENSANTSVSEIDVNKPIKPRIPPQRTSVLEMKRRVLAILEFISRTQQEIDIEQTNKSELTRFVENEEFVKKVDSVYETYNESLSLMDDLTKNLLHWEEKYSESKHN